jgi:hypothetical protein
MTSNVYYCFTRRETAIFITGIIQFLIVLVLTAAAYHRNNNTANDLSVQANSTGVPSS